MPRGAVGKTGESRSQAASRFRPLARRRFNTSRPPWVAIRVRNPWVRLRRRTFGWNVRFMAKILVGSSVSRTSPERGRTIDSIGPRPTCQTVCDWSDHQPRGYAVRLSADFCSGGSRPCQPLSTVGLARRLAGLRRLAAPLPRWYSEPSPRSERPGRRLSLVWSSPRVFHTCGKRCGKTGAWAGLAAAGA